jgi:hypothetical protein
MLHLQQLLYNILPYQIMLHEQKRCCKKDGEAKKPQSPPEELKQNPYDSTTVNKKDLGHLRDNKEGSR